MTRVLAIAGREFRSFFSAPLGFVVIAVFLLPRRTYLGTAMAADIIETPQYTAGVSDQQNAFPVNIENQVVTGIGQLLLPPHTDPFLEKNVLPFEFEDGVLPVPRAGQRGLDQTL